MQVRNHPAAPSCCSTLTKITFATLAIIAYLGRGFITQRPECMQWNDALSEIETTTFADRTNYAITEGSYRALAQYRCDNHFEELSEIEEFCLLSSFPKGKIPIHWTSSFAKERPELGLDYFATCATVRQKILTLNEGRLKEKIAEKPLLCSRVQKV